MLHRINLKGPWQYEHLDGEPLPELATRKPILDGSRVKMPSDWQAAFGTRRGRIRFSRRFHMPTNLSETERVHIAFDGVGGAVTVALNGHPIGGLRTNTSKISFDVTELLQPSNMLVADVSYDAETDGELGGLWSAVGIEITDRQIQ